MVKSAAMSTEVVGGKLSGESRQEGRQRDMRTKITVVALLALAGMLVGCGKPKNETPKAALEAMAKAMTSGDSEAFVSCFDATEDEAKILKTMCELGNATMEFEKAMVKAYGEDAVGKTEKNDFKEMLDGTWLEKVTIKIDGD